MPKKNLPMLKPRQNLNETRDFNEHAAVVARAGESRHSSSEEAWAAICRRLRAELGDAIFGSWFARLELDSLSEGTAHLSVPTKFLKSWIQAHYAEKLLEVIGSEFVDAKHIVLSVRSSSRPLNSRSQGELAKGLSENASLLCEGPAQRPMNGIEIAKGNPQSQGFDKSAKSTAREPADGDVLAGSPLDKRLNFSTFLVGRSNQLAHAAAQSVAFASSAEPLSFNPLYIHASVGLGKTHLLQAIAHAAASAKRRVIYLTAEKFMHGFVCAL